jgi:hypothetical protein
MRTALWVVVASLIALGLVNRAGSWAGSDSAVIASAGVAAAAWARGQVLRFMPVLLLLAGIGIGQSTYLASLIESFFETGILLSPCPSDAPDRRARA